MARLKIIYLLFLAAGITYALLTVDMSGLLSLRTGAISVPMVILALVSQLAFWVMISVGWARVLFFCASRTIRLLDAFSHISLLLVGKYLPGKVWGLIARGTVLKQYDIETSKIVKSTYLEQIISIHAGAVVGAVGIVLASEQAWRWLLLVVALVSVVAAPLLNLVFSRAFINLVARFRNIDPGLDFDISFVRYLSLFLLYAVEWVCIGAVLLFLAFGVLGSELDVVESIQVVTFAATAMLVGFVALFAPGGIGVRESVLTYFLSDVMTLENAILLAMIYRVWLTASDVVAGGLALFLKDGGERR